MKLIPRHSTLIFLTGAVILGLELTASRYMSPMFGTSLYIWGAILSVTLLCLSAGYSLGGRLGERLASPINRLVLFVLLSGAWIGVLPLIQRPVAVLGITVGSMMGPLVVMTLLFALPILLLATATPLAFAENNRERHGDRASAVMGDLFAISTVGSVFGALITAYGFIPTLGLKSTLLVLSVSLFAAAAVYVVKGIHLRSATNLIVVVVIAQIAYTPVSDAKLKDNFTIIHRESSRYAELSVLQRDDGSRLLLMDGTTQNWVAGEGFDKSLFDYTDVIASHLSQYPSSSRNALVLGLGAGVFPKNLKALGWSVDTVEINPAVPVIARDYFNFDPTLPVYIQDGRSFLEEARANNKRYGLIVLDVANGGGQPAHLFNIEAFQLMHDLLEEDGVLANNQLLTLADGMNEIALHSLATLRQLFPHVRGFDVYPEQPDEWLTNFVIFSSKQPPIDPEHRSHLQETLYERETIGYRVISDDWNPFELWAAKDNEQWHRNIIEWLGENAVIVI